METRPCEHCGEPLPRRAQRNARFCDVTCRVAAHRARKAAAPVLPRELTSRPRWVRYSVKKIPLQSVGRQVASSTDRSTWSSYEAAAASSRGVGMGFVLDGDGIVCIDLDRCVLPGGRLVPWARRVVERAGATYVEVSPSGSGVHIWGRARLAQGRVVAVRGGGKAEVYPNGRYITVTSQRWGDTPSVLGDLTALVGELIS